MTKNFFISTLLKGELPQKSTQLAKGIAMLLCLFVAILFLRPASIKTAISTRTNLPGILRIDCAGRDPWHLRKSCGRPKSCWAHPALRAPLPKGERERFQLLVRGK